jgi:hypothetical protein
VETKTKVVAVIGGGAAGMMAAVSASANGAKVLLFEKNINLGAKVMISGGGRCNLTTGILDVRKVLENYPRGAKFLTKAMFNFGPEDVMKWFEDHGVKLKTEEDLRVFPVSNDGREVVVVFEKVMRENGVEVHFESCVFNIERAAVGAGFIIKLTDGMEYQADAVIISVGGNAYRQTGSTGDGYEFARRLGHNITKLMPSLGAMVVREGFLMRLPGISFKNAGLSLVSADGKRTYMRNGPFLFTHKGVSGPAVFALSAMAAFEEYDVRNPLKLFINFFPDASVENFKIRFDSLVNANGKKHLMGLLDMILPKSLADLIVAIAAVEKTLPVAELNREQRKIVFNLLVRFNLNITGRVSGDEFVTAGGVDLDEVDSSTMQSKICQGLYFAGEVLNVDGFTGGFNLQAAWATGSLAGFRSTEN